VRTGSVRTPPASPGSRSTAAANPTAPAAYHVTDHDLDELTDYVHHGRADAPAPLVLAGTRRA